MINVARQRHDGRDLAALGGRRRSRHRPCARNCRTRRCRSESRIRVFPLAPAERLWDSPMR
jgi:hypothetical protein